VQELVRVTASRLSQDVAERFKEIDAGGAGNEQKKGRVGDWAELVFRSVLSSAGSLVVSDPARFLGIEDKGQSALVGGVGSAVLGMVLDDEGLRLDRVFSRDGLETVIRAALTVAADHPELLGDVKNEGLRKLLGQVAGELAALPGLMEKGVLPELVRVVIEKTGENLELLWPDLKKPQSNLALAAARRTLEILSRKPPAGSGWLAPFGRRELLEVVGRSG
jgi:hypothetical protein